MPFSFSFSERQPAWLVAVQVTGTELPLELAPQGKKEKKGNRKIHSMGSEETPSPCTNFTEFVCVRFQNFWEGFCDAVRELITSASRYCADFEEQDKTGLKILQIS